MAWLKRFALLAAVLGIAGGIYLLIRPQAVPADLAVIARGDIETVIDEEGETRVRDVYRVSAPIAGKVERLTVHVGDRVLKGQRLARIRPADPPIYDERTRRELAAASKAAAAGVDLAQAEVARAQSARVFSLAEVDRARRLAAQNTIPVRSLEQAELDVEVKTAQLAEARANLELRRRELESARARELQPLDLAAAGLEDQCCVAVVAPVPGSVLALLSESERVVEAGTALADLGDLGDLEIVVDLLSADAVAITPDTPARIVGWGGAGTLAARVRRIDPAGFTKVSALGIEEQRVNAVLDLTGPPERWSRLGHGYRVIVRLVTDRRENVLTVPISALFRSGEQWAVFRIEDGRAQRADVALGAFSPSHAEVTGGLAEGDQVVVYPSDRIAPGVRIEPREVPGG